MATAGAWPHGPRPAPAARACARALFFAVLAARASIPARAVRRHGGAFKSLLAGFKTWPAEGVAKAPAEGSITKTITFIRHGESAGNAMKGTDLVGKWKGALKALKSNVTIASGSVGVGDFSLTSAGVAQVAERFELLLPSVQERIQSAEVVLVSPLKRALATALLVIAHAWAPLLANATGRLIPPRLAVASSLREKVKTASEWPGRGGDIERYLKQLTRKITKKFFHMSGFMDELLTQMIHSYNTEKERTAMWTKGWVPDDALTMADMVRAFKVELSTPGQNNILLVGHSGWARFAFAHLLPAAAEDEQKEAAEYKLKYNVRRVHPLHNTGVFCVVLQDGMFQRDGSAPECNWQTLPIHGAGQLPNYRSKPIEAMFCDVQEAMQAGVVQPGSWAKQWLVTEVAEGFVGKCRGEQHTGLLTLSRQPGVAVADRLAFSDKWGKPKDDVALSDIISYIREGSTVTLDNTRERRFTFKHHGFFEDEAQHHADDEPQARDFEYELAEAIFKSQGL